MAAERKILKNLLETAEILAIPPKWLKDAAVSGKVPCLFVSKRQMLFDPTAVEEAMALLARKRSSPKVNDALLKWLGRIESPLVREAEARAQAASNLSFIEECYSSSRESIQRRREGKKRKKKPAPKLRPEKRRQTKNRKDDKDSQDDR